MKRYRIEHRRPYADDPEAVEEVPVEDENGHWVPADVARALADALQEATTALEYVYASEGHYVGPDQLEKYHDALALVGRKAERAEE